MSFYDSLVDMALAVVEFLPSGQPDKARRRRVRRIALLIAAAVLLLLALSLAL